jgi:hypothetical protein
MIFSDWQMPKPFNESNSQIIASDTEQDLSLNDLKSHLDKAIYSLFQSLNNQSLNDVYKPNGKIPFPKDNFDLDDKFVSNFFKANSVQDDIQETLASYGIVCPGAESLEITKDISDPFMVTFVIKKTIF